MPIRVCKLLGLLLLLALPVSAQDARRSVAGELQIVQGPLKISQPSNYSTPLVIENKLFVPTGPNQTAIEIDWPNIPSSFITSVFIRNVVIAPGNGFHWRTGIHLHHGWNAQISHVNLIGPGGVPNPLSENAIVLSGQSNDVALSHIHIAGWITGVFITGGAFGEQPEGFRMSNFTIIGGIHGIVSHTEGTEPGLFVSNGHINVTRVAIWLRNRREWFLSDLLLYAGDYVESTSGGPMFGVLLDNSPIGDIRGVKISDVSEGRKIVVPQHFTQSPRINGSVERVF